MKQTKSIPHNFQRTLSLALSAGLVLSQAFYGSAKAENTTETFSDHVLTRVDQTSDTGLVRSYLEDSNGNIYTDNTITENTASAGGSNLKKASSLPEKYDLRDYGLTTSIKDQGLTGCCWAFSAIKAIESNCIKLGLLSPDNADFSENHLAWFSYSPSTKTSDSLYGDGISVTVPSSTSTYPDPLFQSGTTASTYPYINGGSATLATFTLAKWSGLEQENLAPFTAASQQSLNAMASSMTGNESLRYDSYAHMQNAISFDEYLVGENYYYRDINMISEMKQSVLDNGAMSVAFYFDKSYVNSSPNGTSYFQTYLSGSEAVKDANHCVTIIGWDDNYSKDNFATPPAGDGAWLIANSYGTEFGDSGYFWLSYYDQSICDCYTFLTESVDNYDNIYQYDGFGWGNANYSNSYNIKAANIFTADSQSPQQLRAVSFYTLTDNQPYKIQIYRGVSSTPTNGILISECTTSGTMEHNGYHTVPLSSPVNLKAGEKFSVVVTYIQTGSSSIYVPFEGKDTTSASLSMQYSSKKGQSFLYTKLTSTSSRTWLDTSVLGYNNVCIKAFTDNTDSATPLPKVKKKITLGKGETYKLSNSYQTYTSNDPAIVSVSGSGKVTANKVGTTNITVSDKSTSSLVQITVKKAPSTVRLIAPGKKNVKTGKSFQLKTKLSSGSASNKITYRSSRKRIASVSSSGKVTTHRPGTAVIRVRTYNGKTARFKITVTKK